MTVLSDQMRRQLADGKVLFGLGHHFPAPAILEAMCPGWDFVWIDMQHGQHDYFSALDSIRIAQAMGLATLLRVDTHDPLMLGKYADMGTTSLLIPMVNTADQARAIVRALEYPPRGDRSFASRRLVDLIGVDHHLKTGPMVMAQIETPQAVAEVDAIAAVEGVDALFFGPDDFRLGSDIPFNVGLLDHPQLKQATERIADAATRVGKHAALPAATPQAVKQAMDMGYRIFIGGGDAGFVRATARERIAALDAVRQGAVPEPTSQPYGSSYT